jgi:hypothetical protein
LPSHIVSMRRDQYTIEGVTDPTDPPRKNKRAKRPEPDYVIDPNKPNATIELETADLVSLATGGTVDGRAARTRDVQRLPKEQNVFVDLGGEPEEIAPPPQPALPAPPRASTPLDVVAPRASVPTRPLPQEHRITEAKPVEPPKPAPVIVTPKIEVRRPTSEIRAPKRGLGVVVIVYVIAAAALALSIYVRWFA